MLPKIKFPFVAKLLLTLAATALVVFGLARISFNVKILDLLPPNIEQSRGLAVILTDFGLPQELIVTVETPDPVRTEAAAFSLAAHLRDDESLTRLVVDQPLWEASPEKLSGLAAYTAINLPTERFARIVTALDPAASDSNARETADDLATTLSGEDLALLSYDPYRILPNLQSIASSGGNGKSVPKSEFVSADGTFRAIYVTAAPELSDYRIATEWIGKVRASIAAWKSSQDDPDTLSIGVAGDPAFVSELSSGMEKEMRQSGLITAAIVGLIFFAVYRRLIPLACLIALLGLSFAIALSIAGFLDRGITIISAGFASILVGINVDYGLIIYQSYLTHREDSRALRRRCLPGIAWAAATTAAAFASLNFSGVPGLAQLGTLVALGVGAGAFLMLVFYTKAVHRFASPPSAVHHSPHTARLLNIGTTVTALLFLITIASLLISGPPPLESTAKALQPRNSLAYETVNRIYEKLADSPRTLNLLVTGDSPDEIHERLQTAAASLETLKQEGLIKSTLLPTAFWPNTPAQRANLAAIAPAIANREKLAASLAIAGFTNEAFALTGALIDQWSAFTAGELPIWPEDPYSRWVLRRAMHKPDAAMGTVEPSPDLTDAQYAGLPARVNAPGIALLSWPLLGTELANFAANEMIIPLVIFAVVLVVMLILAFRNAFDVFFAIGILALNTIALLGGMNLFGFTWNFMNVASALLLLGTGVDFSIHMIRSLRETHGDLILTQRTVGTALLLCGITTTTGFASIAWAASEGLASLGRVCALGFAANTLIAIFLLPRLWVLAQKNAVLNKR